METYSIGVTYKGRSLLGFVHRFTDSYSAFFSDSEILKEYGGLISFSKDLKPLSARTNLPSDFKDFCAAVAKQLH